MKAAITLLILMLTMQFNSCVLDNSLENITKDIPDASIVPWEKISGKIAFVHIDQLFGGTYKRRLYVIDGNTKTVKEKNNYEDDYFSYARISTFGEQISYTTNTQNLSIFYLDSIVTKSMVGCFWASYNRKNEMAYFRFGIHPRNYEIYVNHQIVPLPIVAKGKVDFGKDDEFIVYGEYGTDSSARMVKYNFSDSTYSILLDPLNNVENFRVRDCSVSPDGKRIVYTKSFQYRSSEIWMIDIDGSNDTKLLSSPNKINYNYPFWSPDGNYILYTSYDILPPYTESVNDRNIGLYDINAKTQESLININADFASWTR